MILRCVSWVVDPATNSDQNGFVFLVSKFQPLLLLHHGGPSQVASCCIFFQPTRHAFVLFSPVLTFKNNGNFKVFIDLSTGDGKDGSGIISKSHLQVQRSKGCSHIHHSDHQDYFKILEPKISKSWFSLHFSGWGTSQLHNLQNVWCTFLCRMKSWNECNLKSLTPDSFCSKVPLLTCFWYTHPKPARL